jgi:hypothetical protein
MKFCKELIAYFPLIRLLGHRNWRVQQFLYCCVCIHGRGKAFVVPLPSNDREIHMLTQRPMGEIKKFDAEKASGAMTYTPSSIKICLGIQKLIWSIHRHTGTQTLKTAWWSHKSTFIFSKQGNWAKNFYVCNMQASLIGYIIVLRLDTIEFKQISSFFVRDVWSWKILYTQGLHHIWLCYICVKGYECSALGIQASRHSELAWNSNPMGESKCAI